MEFTLEGLEPWQEVVVEFLDPRGQAAEWITDNEGHYARADGMPVTTKTLYADDSGQLEWQRIGTKDGEGIWSVKFTVGGEPILVTYPVTQLQLSVQEVEALGVDLRRYQGFVSDVYYSALVPAALVTDLQAHLAWVVDELESRTGIRSGRIPDLYLLGSRGHFETVSEATGREIGFEDGYYRSGGIRPGIYMRTDFLRTSVQRILTHEYVHLVLDEVAGARPIPAWLGEGVSRFFEYELGLRGERPDVTRRTRYRAADLAGSAAQTGILIPLPALESRVVWNAQSDAGRIQLQYAQAYMAVLFLVETHGTNTPIDMIRATGEGDGLAEAIQTATGVSYGEFEERFLQWLMDWEEPERGAVREYLQKVNDMVASLDDISARRQKILDEGRPLREQLSARRDLESEARDLLAGLDDALPPPEVSELHDDAVTNVSRVITWLSLEREYAESGNDSKRVQANDMLPEVNARERLLRRRVNNLEFVYQIQG